MSAQNGGQAQAALVSPLPSTEVGSLPICQTLNRDAAGATQRENGGSGHAALIEVIQQLPQALKRSLTWDRGAELAEHKVFAVATGGQVYFCDPRSPRRRGVAVIA